MYLAADVMLKITSRWLGSLQPYLGNSSPVFAKQRRERPRAKPLCVRGNLQAVNQVAVGR
jgi:hypothetical protein